MTQGDPIVLEKMITVATRDSLRIIAPGVPGIFLARKMRRGGAYNLLRIGDLEIEAGDKDFRAPSPGEDPQ